MENSDLRDRQLKLDLRNQQRALDRIAAANSSRAQTGALSALDTTLSPLSSPIRSPLRPASAISPAKTLDSAPRASAPTKREFPKLFYSVELESKVPTMEARKQLDAWIGKRMTFPEWLLPFALQHPRACLRLNHPKGAGCALPTCTMQHICLLCGNEGHGTFQIRRSVALLFLSRTRNSHLLLQRQLVAMSVAQGI
jgi:hypothetical protein